MWPGQYWSPEFWAANYWAKTGAQPVGGAAVAGRRLPAVMRALAVQEYERSLLDAASMQAVQHAIARRAAVASWLRKIEAEYHQKCLEWAAYSVVLTEV